MRTTRNNLNLSIEEIRERQAQELRAENLSGSSFDLKEWLKKNDNSMIYLIGRYPAEERWELAKDVDGNIILK